MTEVQLLDVVSRYAGTLVTAFVGGGAGAYLGSYLKKKGENLATHEDIRKLVDQVSAVTQATKEIEASISNDVWDRQKRWELKRDALLDAVRALADLELGMSLYILSYSPLAPGERRSTDRIPEIWNDTLLKLKKARLVTSLVSGDGLTVAFGELEQHVVKTTKECLTNPNIRNEWLPLPRERTTRLIVMLGSELDMVSARPSVQQLRPAITA